MKQQRMLLRYNAPSPECNEDARYATREDSWQNDSLPLGNGYFGANIFGRTEVERIQISEPTLVNPWLKIPKGIRGCPAAGVNSFAELHITLGHTDPAQYERSLSLDDACAYVSYKHGNVTYQRTAFTSYPDKILAVRFGANTPASVTLSICAEIPFLGEYTVKEDDGLAKRGTVTVKENAFIFEGTMEYFGIEYYGILKVIHHGGTLSASDTQIRVENADDVVLLFSCDTNYKLCDQIFSESDPKGKLSGFTMDKAGVRTVIEDAASRSFEDLLTRHLNDYRALYTRSSLQISNNGDENLYTDQLLELYREGKHSTYLEALLFQYGRYLLIASSRSRLPAHLQGIWNAYCDSPWSCGYWHNINIQMNYWPSGPANLSELFVPYINYAKAYMRTARRHADDSIRENFPEQDSGDEQNGWTIGTGCSAYYIKGSKRVGHSGPGTGAFTSLLFWDHFDYTRDLDFLRDFGYPALRGMSLFFSKILVRVDDKYLIQTSASPENVHEGAYYHTVGCGFDQQMVYENFKRTIEAAEILGINDDFIESLKEMLPHLDPVLIGDDGQVKEYREETTYASIGDPKHRHISHLVGLYPATIINDDTPEWLEGAKVTLTNRGDVSTGWAAIHRLLLWARTKTPHKCRDLLNSFILHNLNNNLWCSHPPFQIDGNFGYTAAVSEMLLQSHSDAITLLPAIPAEWQTGAFTGLVARGNFVIDCAWEDGQIQSVRITARSGGTLKIKLPAALVPDGKVAENGVYQKKMATGESILFHV